MEDADGALRQIRRSIHAHPETGFEEVRTSHLVAETLRALGIEVHEGIATTGVVGVLNGTCAGGRERGRAIALRADMDALHITEENAFEHRSRVPGKMHACGHDGHTAMLLGAARCLAQRQRQFSGTLYFVFQPAEEHLAGARAMLAAGLFERFPCDAIYGMHVRPGYPAGHFCTRRGPLFAASDRWLVTFSGSGGHGGSAVHTATDPTLALGHFLLGLHSIVARNVPATDTAVLSVGHIAAGDEASPNVIPSTAVVGGTARSFRPEVRGIIESRLAGLAQSVAQAHGCQAAAQYTRGYPPVVNSDRETDAALAAATAVAGRECVVGDMEPRTAADDFAFYLEQRPGAFVMIGNGLDSDGKFHGVHTPKFDFNDEIIVPGVRYWVELALREMRSGH
ncbi:MAG: amidohydrolase [Betaproteobacteria bacterium]|nr:amidohydrolase [Betaproteobacteria bacterium]